MLGYHPSWSRHPPPPADPPGAGTQREQTATVADGTHPTGMHSCYMMLLQLLQEMCGKLILNSASKSHSCPEITYSSHVFAL